MANRKQLPGKFTWYELVSTDAKKAQAFYGEVLGWRVQSFPMGDFTYDMVYLGDTMIGGYAPRTSGRERSRWLACVSVENVDGAAEAAAANGGKVLEPPSDIPGVGRRARIADPQGAEVYLLKNAGGDPPDGQVPDGGWLWNELHTTDPASALAFYEKVVGFSHRAQDMGPGGTYYIIGKGGVDRGGVTAHLPPGAAPHWLPYVSVEDPDATIARARKLGARIPFGPEDIAGVGRFGVLEDPTGAELAVMKAEPAGRDK